MWQWFHIHPHRGCSVLAGLFLFLAVFSGSVELHEDTSIFLCAIMLLSCIFLTSFVMLILSELLPWFDAICTDKCISQFLSSWVNHAWARPSGFSPLYWCQIWEMWEIWNETDKLPDVVKKKRQWKHCVLSSAMSVLFVTYYLTLLCRILKINRQKINNIYRYCIYVLFVL